MRYLIIGNSASAIGGVEGIRSLDRDGEITILSDEPFHAYSRPLISYLLQGKVNERDMLYRNEDFYIENKVNAILGRAAKDIDTDKNRVILSNGDEIEYDRLLISTGGKPILPPIKGIENQENIFTFMKISDIKSINEYISQGSKNAVIIGGGLIGLKAAEALCGKGISVTVIELAGNVLNSVLDKQGADIVRIELEKNGVKVKTGNSVEEVRGEHRVTQVVLKDGSIMDCELLILAVGVTPNIDIVKDTEIEVSKGIIINDRMETNVAGIFAAGDVSQGNNMVTGQSVVIPIWPNAYSQGYVAGVNMAGGDETYCGGLPMNSLTIFSIPFISAGFINAIGGHEEISSVKKDNEIPSYIKVIIEGDRLVGFIKLGQIDRAGLYTNLIKEGINIDCIKEKLLYSDFGFKYLPKEYRKAKMAEGALL